MTVVAVLGTGTMGAPITRNLARAGFQVRVWNRTHEKAAELAGGGVTACAQVSEAVSGVDAVLTVLADGEAVRNALGTALDDFGDAIWLQTSTVGLGATEQLAAAAHECGVTFVDSPVLGTKQPAEQGDLVVLASGPDAAREQCEPIFDAIGSRTVWLGAAGAGTRMKIVINAWLAALVASLAESIVLARGLDVDPARFLQVIDGSPVNAPYAQLKGRAMIEEGFEPSFALRLARKDVGLVLEAAGRAGLEPRVAQAVAQQFDRAIAGGHGEEDIAAAYYGAR